MLKIISLLLKHIGSEVEIESVGVVHHPLYNLALGVDKYIGGNTQYSVAGTNAVLIISVKDV